jgi:hypothetical protein
VLAAVAVAATAAIALAAVLALARGPTRESSGATELARIVTRPMAEPAPADDPRRPALLAREFAGVEYPNWTTEFGWTAAGARSDRVGGRRTDTVYYRHTHHHVAYTVVAGKPLEPPADADTVRIDGVTIHRFADGPRDVVTFVRGGHTCVLSGEVRNPATLLMLAAWAGDGSVRFS